MKHNAIYIDGDDNFNETTLTENWPGNGSLQNPFIIQELDIDLGGTAEPCIHINSTRVHFIIRDCNLLGSNQSDGVGIKLLISSIPVL
jgi:hypothetical protein